MKIAYLCVRENFLKTIGACIVEGINYGINQTLIIPSPQNNIWKNKNGTNATIERIKKYSFYNNIRVVEVKKESDIFEYSCYLNTKPYDYIISTTGHTGLSRNIIDNLKKQGSRFVLLAGNGDEIRTAESTGYKSLEDFDIITTVNNYFKSYIPEKLINRSIAIGNPEYDQIRHFNFNRESILKKYGLPDKNILLTIPYPAFVQPDGKFITDIFKTKSRTKREILKYLANVLIAYKCIARNINVDFINNVEFCYENIIDQIHQIASLHKSVVVCKTRQKDIFRNNWNKDYYDYVVHDDMFYPFSTLELMSISQMYYGFESYCCCEAIAMCVPAVSILATPRVLEHNDLSKTYHDIWTRFLNVDGVSTVVKLYAGETIPFTHGEYNRRNRTDFMEKFFSGYGFYAAQTFIKILKNNYDS